MSSPAETAVHEPSSRTGDASTARVALLAAIIDASEDAIISKTLDGIITSWNPAAERMYGYAADEALGRHIGLVMPPEKADEATTLLERIASGLTVAHHETVRLHKNGDRIPVSLTVSPVRDADGFVIGASAIARENTERLTFEKQMVAVSLYARSLVEASLDPLVTISPDGKITDVNEATVNVTGLHREELIGTDFADYFTEPQNARDIYQRVFAEGSVTDYMLTIRHVDGNLCDVLYNASTYTDTSGNVLGAVAAARDITERVRTERALQVRTDDLARSNAELEQFAYVASHDLSEPLRAISGPITLLARQYDGKLGDDADEYIQFAVDGCQRMQAIINGLLAYSRVGRVEAALKPVDANVVVDGVIAALTSAIDESGAEISVQELPTVRAEATQLSLVFQNLVSNALKFVPSDVRPRIEVAAEPLDREWYFTVTDNGIGIDPKQRDRVFGMFKRLHGREEYPGTGIGLALVRKIVERHGGTVGIDDAPGGGSRFWFTIAT